MRLFAALVVFASVFGGRASAEEPVPEHWSPVQRLIGSWAGTASGEPGEGTVQRRYAFSMNGRFIHETNTSTYPPQEKNKAGEVHQHWGMFSFDKVRKTLVLRQFHVESFVEFLSDDEFVETFELAPPGKPFRIYSRGHFRRVQP